MAGKQVRSVNEVLGDIFREIPLYRIRIWVLRFVMCAQFVFVERFFDFVQEESRTHEAIEESCCSRLNCEYRIVVNIDTGLEPLIHPISQKVLVIRRLVRVDVFDNGANVFALLRVESPTQVAFLNQLQLTSNTFNHRIEDCINPSLDSIRARRGNVYIRYHNVHSLSHLQGRASTKICPQRGAENCHLFPLQSKTQRQLGNKHCRILKDLLCTPLRVFDHFGVLGNGFGPTNAVPRISTPR